MTKRLPALLRVYRLSHYPFDICLALYEGKMFNCWGTNTQIFEYANQWGRDEHGDYKFITFEDEAIRRAKMELSKRTAMSIKSQPENDFDRQVSACWNEVESDEYFEIETLIWHRNNDWDT